MRIFFVATKLNFDKGGSMVENDLIARKLQELGNEVTMLTVFSESNKYCNTPYRVIEEQIKNRRQLSIQRGVFQLLKKYSGEADIFLIEGQTFFYGAGFYRWVGGPRPIVAFFVREQVSWPENVSSFLPGSSGGSKFLSRFFYSSKRCLRWYIERYILIFFANSVDFFAWCSPLLREEYKAFGLVTEKKSILIGDPYPFDEVMRRYGLSKDSYATHTGRGDFVTIFYSSRMAPGKGFDVLVKAFARVKNKDNFRLILGGDGPEKPFIEQMVKNLGLEPFVQIPGWIPKEDFHQSLMKADIFIHPRWRTAQPSLGLVEAMTFGLPTIVPEGTGLHLVAGKSALTFKLDDVEDLKEKIEILGRDEVLRKKLSKECYLRLEEPDVDYRKTIPALFGVMKKLVIHKKVCLVLPEYSPKTATHFAYLYRLVERTKDEIDYCLVVEHSLGKKPPFSEGPCYRQRFTFLPFRAVENFLFLFWARVKGYKNFYVHYSFLSAWNAGIVCRLLGGRVFYWNCGLPWLYLRSWSREMFERLTYKAVTFLVTGTEGLAALYARHYALPLAKIKIFPNWVDGKDVKERLSKVVVSEVKRRLNIGDEERVILFAHRLSKRKGAHYLPEILARLHTEKVILLIAGDGPERANLERETKARGLERKTRFLGWVPQTETAQYFKTAEVFIMPSEEEGFPHVLLEAMAIPIPFVAFAVGGVPEIIPVGLKSCLIEESRVDLLTRKIDEILSSARLAEEIKAVETAHVKTFDLEKVIPIWQRLF